jgi:4a-hydroxytetrahydrobiopterin dehydratase
MDDRTILESSETSGDLAGTAFTHESGRLSAAYRTGDFLGAVRLLDAVAPVAEEMNHHPDVVIGYGRVVFALSSHDVGGVTARDVRLALSIQRIADEQGATAG